MNTFLDTLKSLGATRLAIMGAVAAGILAFFIYLTSQLASQEYGLLFAGLNSNERSQIVSALEKRGVNYQVTGGGKNIEVPAAKVDQLRVAMAEKGLPSSGSVGYEIFDKSGGLGTTNFVQNVNRVRAIQGELERTIRSMNNVEQARVHVVMPQRELFNQERKKSSASIVLRMSGNQRLDESQVQAVQHLVSSAVPNLKPNMVSIVDGQGTLLARGEGKDSLGAIASNAQEIRANRERRIARAVERLIGRHVGPGNVRAEVSAKMNFSQVTEKSRQFDPAEQVARSEQTTQTQQSEREVKNQEGVTVGNQLPENQQNQNNQGTLQRSSESKEEETINYEISNTQTTRVKRGPRLERLSVAVLVDGKYVTNDNGEKVYQQRSQEELQKIASLARSAVGFSKQRGDQLEVINMKFTNPARRLKSADDGGLLGLPEGQLMRAAELLVLGVVAVLILLLVVRPLVSRLLESAATQPAPQPAGAAYGADQMLPEGGGAAAGQLPAGGGAVAEFGADEDEEEAEQLVDLNRVEGRVRASSMRKISEIVDRHPEEAVTILRNWLYQQ